MFRSVGKGLEAYKQETRKFADWINSLRERDGERFNISRLPPDEFNALFERGAKIGGMEKALGLTDKEVRSIMRRAGVDLRSATEKRNAITSNRHHS